MPSHISRPTLVSLAVLSLGIQPAWALDADDFAAKLQYTLQYTGISVDIGSARVEGTSVVLSDFIVRVPGEDPFPISGDVTFAEVSETPDGGYRAASAFIDDVLFEDEEATVSLENIRAEGLVIPGTMTPATLLDANFSLYERVSAGPLRVSITGEESFTVDETAIWIDRNEDSSEIVSGFVIEGIRADLSNVPDAEAQAVIAAFGVEQLSASFSGVSTWDVPSGRATIDEMALTIDNLARMDITGAVTGYTPELYRELVKLNMKMAEMADQGTDIAAMANGEFEQAMMNMVMGLGIESLSIRYDDFSLFMKVLDFVAAEQGLDGATFASGLKFMVPAVLTEVPDPAFRSMVSAQVNAFIDNPQNIAIVAEPDQPVPLIDFMAAEDDPFVLIDLLNVEVRANQ